MGNRALKPYVVCEPETRQHILTAEDDLLILSSDGLYRTYSNEHIVRRVLGLRKDGYNLAQICDRVIEECLTPEAGKKVPDDNLTLMLVDLKTYHRYQQSTTHSFFNLNQMQHRVQSPANHSVQPSFKLRQLTSQYSQNGEDYAS